MDLLVCDDIKGREHLFYSPRRLRKGAAALRETRRKVGSLQLPSQTLRCQPFKSQDLAPKVFTEGSRPTNCAALNDLAEETRAKK